MQIKTKFDIGQEVWFFSNGGVKPAVVTAIYTQISEHIIGIASIKYSLSGCGTASYPISEKHLYATEEEAENSLLEGMI